MKATLNTLVLEVRRQVLALRGTGLRDNCERKIQFAWQQPVHLAKGLYHVPVLIEKPAHRPWFPNLFKKKTFGECTKL